MSRISFSRRVTGSLGPGRWVGKRWHMFCPINFGIHAAIDLVWTNSQTSLSSITTATNLQWHTGYGVRNKFTSGCTNNVTDSIDCQLRKRVCDDSVLRFIKGWLTKCGLVRVPVMLEIARSQQLNSLRKARSIFLLLSAWQSGPLRGKTWLELEILGRATIPFFLIAFVRSSRGV